MRYRCNLASIALDPLGALPLLGKLADGIGQFEVIEHHRVEVAHQGAETVLQIQAVLFEMGRGFTHGIRLVRLDPQQAGPGADACQVLSQVVMQGLRQTGALAFLQREQRLCQPVVIRSRVFQRGSHVIEALGEFARLGEAMGRQPGIEPPVGDAHQCAEQLCQHAHAGAHRPTDRQQAKQQGHSEKSQQLQQRIPDFLDLVARIDADLQALAPGKLQLTGSGQLCRVQPRAAGYR